MSVAMESLVGSHTLSGVDEEVVKTESWYKGEYEDCNALRFTLDGVTYMAIEDPDDGYRSSMRGLVVSKTPTKFTFTPIPVVVSARDKGGYEDKDSAEVLEIRDARNGLVILEAGTENTNDYYPYFVGNWKPENMEENR
jgi:hypothetical protein